MIDQYDTVNVIKCRLNSFSDIALYIDINISELNLYNHYSLDVAALTMIALVELVQKYFNSIV